MPKACQQSVLRNDISKSYPRIIIKRLDPWKFTKMYSCNTQNQPKSRKRLNQSKAFSFEDAFSHPCSALGRDELEAELRRSLLHVFDLLIPVLLLVLLHVDLFIFHLVFQHAIDHPRNGMRRGDGRLCLVQP